MDLHYLLQYFQTKNDEDQTISIVTSHPASISTTTSTIKSLESLHLKRRPQKENKDSAYLVPAKAAKYLVLSRKTIHELILEDPDHVWGEDPKQDEAIVKGRLSKYVLLRLKQLRVLNVQESMIFSRAMGSMGDTRLRHPPGVRAEFANALPPFLERLVTTKCTRAVFDAIYELLHNCSRWPINLNAIQVST